jgi:hypothetical protein
LTFTVLFLASLATAFFGLFGFEFIRADRIVIIFVELQKSFRGAFDFTGGKFAVFVFVKKSGEGINRRRSTGALGEERKRER